MRFISGFLGLLILLLAVAFALSNRQPATLSFWPFGFDLSAPLCFFLLAALFGGALLGAGFAVRSMLPFYWDSRRLRRELGKQRERNAELEAARDATERARQDEERKARTALPCLPKRDAARRFSLNHLFSWGPR